MCLNKIHHIAIISSDYEQSKAFYTKTLGLTIKSEVDRVEDIHDELTAQQIVCEAIRIDEFTRKKFFFTFDPDNLPIEFYEK